MYVSTEEKGTTVILIIILLYSASDQVLCPFHCKQWAHTSKGHQSLAAGEIKTSRIM